MKRSLLVTVTGIMLLFATTVLAEKVRDWKDLELVHKHIKEAITEMEHARAANHYDMQGHGAKAEELLRQAEREVHEAIEAAKKGK